MTENERTVVQVRLTARDKKRVEALAASDQVTVSEFVRRLIREALEEERGVTVAMGVSHRPAGASPYDGQSL